jgi:hypothetical protein
MLVMDMLWPGKRIIEARKNTKNEKYIYSFS